MTHVDIDRPGPSSPAHGERLMPRRAAAWQGSTRKRRLPPGWQRTTARILDRDGHQCQIRYDRCTGVATEVDHVRRGDDHRDHNLQAACTSCHRTKTSREGLAARTPPQPRRRPPVRHPGITGGGG